MKLKYTLVFTIISFFVTIAGFAQQYSDQEIGFDAAKFSVSLKEHGVKDENISREISAIRYIYVNQHTQITDRKNEILQKIKSQQSNKNSTSRIAIATPEQLAQDKAALIALYNSTNGSAWTNVVNGNGPWPINDPNSVVTTWNPTTKTGWYGITVGSDGRVNNLNLYNNNLIGNLPSEIGQLNAIQAIDIRLNQLTGNIPPQIGQLNNLISLFFSYNKFNGSIPLEIGQSITIKNLDLSYNQITGTLPSQIGLLTNLEYLALSGNQITGSIPPEIGQLKKLQALYLQSMQMTGSIPPEIGQLTSLNDLYLSTKFSGTIPPEIGQLTNLINFSLEGASISGSIPPEIGQLKKLQALTIVATSISGSIPPEIGQMTSLKTIFLGANKLTGIIPPEIGQLSNLESINFYVNNLTGSIPKEIGQLKKLLFLNLSYNNLSGTIPVEIGLATSLKNLRIDSNNFTGFIPQEIKSLTNLTYLELGENQLEGIIPDLTNLKSLTNFGFTSNKFRFVDFAAQYNSYKSQMTTLRYSSQAKRDTPKTISGPTGSTVTLTMYEDNLFTPEETFQWYKNGVLISGATNRQYTLSNLASENAGNYYCKSIHPTITNPSVPYGAQNLILEREPITLKIINCTPVTGTLNPTTQNTFTNTDVNFSLTTTATGLTYEWTFQNVSNSTTFTSSSATYSYATPGSYNVTLVVTDSNGCKTTFTKIMEVAAKPACVAIVGEIKIPTETATANQNTTFSFQTTATNFTYKWTFYNTNFVQIATATTSTVDRIYTAPGDYLVALELTDQNGCKTNTGKTVKVVAPCDPVVGTIKVNTENPTLYTTAIFTFETTATNLTYSWTVKIPENGGYYNYETGGNPFELYLQHGPGDYKIMLEVKDANGCITKFEKIITPVYDCNMNSLNGVILNMNKPNDYSSPNVLINSTNHFLFYQYSNYNLNEMPISWEFINNNGVVVNSATTQEFDITPTALGKYTLNLKITDNYNCEKNFTKDILVLETCEYNGFPSANIQFANEYNYSEVIFIDANQTKDLILNFYEEQTKTFNYHWNIYDLNENLIVSGNQENFPLTLINAGFYKIKVDVTDPETNCSTQFSKTIGCMINNSCTETNPKSQIVKELFLNVLRNFILRSISGETDEQINASPASSEFIALKPYITDGVKDKIYNFKSTLNQDGGFSGFDFSFSPDRESDVHLDTRYYIFYDPTDMEYTMSRIEDILYFALNQYVSPDQSLISCYADYGGKMHSKSVKRLDIGSCVNQTAVRYINFCPAEDCKPIIGILKSANVSDRTGTARMKVQSASKK
ncbi:PKD domain-containing protein [Flavobacterium sp. LC2016-23]|uniref:leucine-rich repeat domain-containing protein n=1 Tax=Flavobacterium sp. LC2016-23 TaxID=2666330 RepID=UPI0018A21CC2|nr:PKD domain-containing protein [Flavobacterium sp. LC2016-23]